MAEFMSENLDIGGRIRLVREARGLRQSDLATVLGLQRTSVGRWESNVSPPDGAALSAICLRYGINGHWLLTGEGPMESGAIQARMEAGLNNRRASEVLSQGDDAASRALGLGELTALAKLGTAGPKWRLLEALLEHDAGGMTVRELAQALGQEEQEVAAYVALLIRLGALRESRDDSSKVRLRHDAGLSEVRSGEIPDLHQHAIVAATELLSTVLPAMEQKRGRILMLKGRVTQGAAMPLLMRLRDSVKLMAEEVAVEGPEDESFVIVLGLAADTEDMLENAIITQGSGT